jgi:hypothetical protein
MRHDPLFTSWLVSCPSPDESRRLQQRLTTAIDPDATYADVVHASPGGVESASTRAHRLGDYFAKVQLVPGRPETPAAFRILFHRRADAGRPWKDVMARVLQVIRNSSAGTTTALEYRGDEEPESLGRTGGEARMGRG